MRARVIELMATLPIRIYPDPVLRVPGEEVETFDASLKTFLDSMAETMYAANGVGLAAPQVGVSKRITVIDVGPEDAPERIDLVNPRIIRREGKTSFEEGCLSIPGYRDTVSRSTRVIVEAKNATGELFEIDADGLKAICLQHEIDHLDGVLFVDHLSRLKREIFKRWLKRRIEEGPEEP